LSKWWSDTELSHCTLPSSVPDLINHIFEGIEVEFGKQWSRVALACITFSKAGLSDGEMQDILSLEDDHVLNFVFQYSKPEDVRRLPLHVWLRLKRALEGLLVEREHGCFQWYHRQLKETAERRYAGYEEELSHKLMARYFDDLAGSAGESRLVARQPLTLNGVNVWFPQAVVNARRCIEAPHHLVRAGAAMQEQACHELCSIHLVSACVKTGVGFDLLKAVLELYNKIGKSAGGQKRGRGRGVGREDDQRLNDYMRWLLNDMTVMMQSDAQWSVAASCSNQPLQSHPRRD